MIPDWFKISCINVVICQNLLRGINFRHIWAVSGTRISWLSNGIFCNFQKLGRIGLNRWVFRLLQNVTIYPAGLTLSGF